MKKVVNKVFQEYSTGIAFSIQLSKRQCWGLLSMLDRKNDHWFYSGQFIQIGKDLTARGLVEFIKNKKKRKDGENYSPCHKLTRAGRLVIALLKEAQLNMDNTKTLSVIKGEDLWFRRYKDSNQAIRGG